MKIGGIETLRCARCGQPVEVVIRGIIDAMRHGETDDNANNISTGTNNTPMNDKGRTQVRARAEQMKAAGVKFNLIYTSPLMRAYEGAQIIREVLGGTPVQVLRLLRERDVGTQNGKLETLESDAQWARYDFTMEGAEPLADFEKKVREFISRLKREAHGKRIGFMTHGQFCLATVKFVRGWTIEQIMKFEPPRNAGVLTWVVSDLCPDATCGSEFYEGLTI